MVFTRSKYAYENLQFLNTFVTFKRHSDYKTVAIGR